MISIFAIPLVAQLTIASPFFVAGPIAPAAAEGTLSSDDLLVRYFIDEAASGTNVAELVDAGPLSFNLTDINYGASSSMSFVETSGNRGLESTSTNGTQRARRDTEGHVVNTNMQSQKKFTVEYVLRMDSISGAGGRIGGFQNRVGGGGAFMVRGSATTAISMTTVNVSRDEWDGGTGTRNVWHIVIDTTQAVGADRAKVYKDDVEVTSTTISVIALNTAITIPTAAQDLIFFNRENSGSFDRSFDGVLYYYAIYTNALSASVRTENFNRLTTDDDGP